MRAGGSAASAVATNVMLSRMSGENNSGSSRPRTSTTSRRPPTTGTLRSILKVDSAMNWMTVTCQFAAATSAPRFSTVLTSSPVSIPAPIYSTLRAAPPTAALVRPARRGYAADNRGRDDSTPTVAVPGLVPGRLVPGVAVGQGLRAPPARAERRRRPAPRRRRRPAGVRRAARGARTSRRRRVAAPRPDAPRRHETSARRVNCSPRSNRSATRESPSPSTAAMRRRWPGPGVPRNSRARGSAGPLPCWSRLGPRASGSSSCSRSRAPATRRPARSAPSSPRVALPTSRSSHGLGTEALTWTGAPVPVALRPGYEGGGESRSPEAFVLTDLDGRALLEGRVRAAHVAAARNTIRDRTLAALIGLTALFLAWLSVPLLAWGRAARSPESTLVRAAVLVGVIAAARAAAWIAVPLAGSGGAAQPRRGRAASRPAVVAFPRGFPPQLDRVSGRRHPGRRRRDASEARPAPRKAVAGGDVERRRHLRAREPGRRHVRSGPALLVSRTRRCAVCPHRHRLAALFAAPVGRGKAGRCRGPRRDARHGHLGRRDHPQIRRGVVAGPFHRRGRGRPRRGLGPADGAVDLAARGAEHVVSRRGSCCRRRCWRSRSRGAPPGCSTGGGTRRRRRRWWRCFSGWSCRR